MEETTRSTRAHMLRGQRLLKLYRRRKCESLRNRIIEHHIQLVRSIAERVSAKVGRAVQPDDLLTAGVFGLMEAIEKFDGDRRVRFTTFSAVRIRGAMLDELRAMDSAPRRVRSRARRLHTAAGELEAELGRPADDDELAARLELDPSKYRAWQRDARLAGMLYLSSAGAGPSDDGDRHAPALPADPHSEDPVREAQRRMLREILLRSLSRAERLAVTLYYYEDLTMREIGGVLDLSESRVSQMLTSVRARLRAGVSTTRPDIPDELAA